MKKSIQLILTLVIATAINVHAQQYGVSISGGMASFQPDELKDYHNELLLRAPVPVQGFNYFPPYSNIRLELFARELTGLKYGLTYVYNTTGAHGNYTDESGYLNIDQVLTANQVGATVGYMFWKTGHFGLGAYGDLRLGYIRDKVNATIITPYYQETNELKLNVFTPLAEAGLEAVLDFTGFSVGIEAGWLADPGLKFKEGTEYIMDPTISLAPGETLHSNISGWRTGIRLVRWLGTDGLSE